MKLTFEKNGNQYIKEDPTIEDIELAIDSLNPSSSPYVILESDSSDYIQCAGGLDGVVVEVRLYSSWRFKHFVLGNKEPSKVWVILNKKVGPIRILSHEKLGIDDAKKLFDHFLRHKSVSPEYNQRNVTKLFS